MSHPIRPPRGSLTPTSGAVRPITVKNYVYTPAFAASRATSTFSSNQGYAASSGPRYFGRGTYFGAQRAGHSFQGSSRNPFQYPYRKPFASTNQRFVNFGHPGSSSANTWTRHTIEPSTMKASLTVPTLSSSASAKTPTVTSAVTKGDDGVQSSAKSGPMKPIVPLNRINSTTSRKSTKIFPSKFVQASTLLQPRSRNFIRTGADSKFSVRKYSVQRIRTRRLSIHTSPKAKKLSSPFAKGSGAERRLVSRYKLVTRKSLNSAASQSSQFIGGFRLPTSKLSLTPVSQKPVNVYRATKAIQRSRMTLSKSKQKKNTFCTFYCKFGICKRKEDSNCPFIHDPRLVTICSVYLKSGKCDKKSCTLSHDRTIGKVPHCKFYRNGQCKNPGCVFRHVESPSRTRKSSLSLYSKSAHHIKKSDPDPDSSDSGESDSGGGGRYFDASLDSQPIVSVIPRRVRVDPTNSDESSNDLPKSLALESKASSCVSVVGPKSVKVSESVDLLNDDTSTAQSPRESSIKGKSNIDQFLKGNARKSPVEGKDERRKRLLERVTKIKQKPQMPTFLKFNQN